MDIDKPLALLGGLTAAQFMRRHWQKKPLLVRGAIAPMTPPITRAELFALAASEDVESRLIQHGAKGWSLRHGPIPRRALPPLDRPNWTVLVQGVNLHDVRVQGLLDHFRFLPDARFDDLMISYAGDGGGVGPHFDSYDVFLLQVTGQRRWSIGRQGDQRLVPGMPLKILANFEPEETFTLGPGDMLYLPPHYAHDGVAVGGECSTYSVGLRTPARSELAADLLVRIAEAHAETLDETTAVVQTRYRDPKQPAVTAPAAMPAALQDFARDAVQAALRDPDAVALALGELLTEPKPQVWFDGGQELVLGQGVALDRRTRMLYDERHLYINGEAFRASGRDARLMRQLADERRIDAAALARASQAARDLLAEWCEAGWVHAD